MMKRREFLGVTAAATCLVGTSSVVAAENTEARDYYEWRTYQLDDAAKQQKVLQYLEQAAVPAWKRLGIGPVGVFTETGEASSNNVHVLLTFRSPEQFANSRQALENDPEYQAAGRDYLETAASDPAFERIESSLMVAFDGMPRIEVPTKNPRVLELRHYESYSEAKARRKVDMFNEGEIPIFLDLGFENVFFGETLIGPQMPNLKYMLAADSMEANAAGWKAFIEHPDWLAMRDLPRYADTVSHIEKTYLLPTGFSEI